MCVAGEAWLLSRQQEHCSTVACQARGVRAQSICEAEMMVVVRGPSLRNKECDSPLAQVGETVDFKIVRGEMAKLEPRWATGTFLGSNLLARFGGAQETNNGSVMRSRRSLVCLGTQEGWRWKLQWPAAGGGTSQSHLFNSTARRQAVQLAWEFHRSTRQCAEKDLST